MVNNLLITGAGKGIGKELAKKFINSTEINNLILCSRTEKDLIELKKELSNVKTNIIIFCCDLSNQDKCIDLAEFSNQKKINILINNAAISCPELLLEDISIPEIYNMVNTNLIAPIILCKMINNLKTIINLNSIVGLENKHKRSIYSASKWGLRGFSESLKLESNASIIDVYLSRVKTRDEYKEGMDVGFVANEIYNAFINKMPKLVLDDRPIG